MGNSTPFPAGQREGGGASLCGSMEEGIPEPQDGNALPDGPVTAIECGRSPNSGGTTDYAFSSP